MCENSHWAEFSNSLFYLGVLLGSFFTNSFSDMFGRKWVVLGGLIVQASIGECPNFSDAPARTSGVAKCKKTGRFFAQHLGFHCFILSRYMQSLGIFVWSCKILAVFIWSYKILVVFFCSRKISARILQDMYDADICLCLTYEVIVCFVWIFRDKQDYCRKCLKFRLGWSN